MKNQQGEVNSLQSTTWRDLGWAFIGFLAGMLVAYVMIVSVI